MRLIDCLWAKKALHLKLAEWKILCELCERELFYHEQAQAILWPDPDRSPLDVKKTVQVHIHRIRIALQRFNIEVHSIWGVGYCIRRDEQLDLRNILFKLQLNEGRMETNDEQTARTSATAQ